MRTCVRACARVCVRVVGTEVDPAWLWGGEAAPLQKQDWVRSSGHPMKPRAWLASSSSPCLWRGLL